MPNNDSLAREFARAFVVFGVLPCALFTAAAYVYVQVFTPLPYAGVNLQDGVIYVSARRYETHGLEVLAENGATIDLRPWNSVTDGGRLKPGVTVLVHGYNAQEHKVATYFADLVSQVQSDAHSEGSLIVFDWPARGVPFDELPASLRIRLEMQMGDRASPGQLSFDFNMYKGDQRTAETAGAQSFLALLAALSQAGDRTVHVVAHSMGCYLLTHALKQKPEAFSRVSDLVWLAPDVDEAVVTEPWFRHAIDGLGRGLVVHFSNNDSLLARVSRVANLSRRLGATGAASIGVSHGKIALIDMTGELGTEGVHGGYLKRGSASAQMIAKLIAGPR